MTEQQEERPTPTIDWAQPADLQNEAVINQIAHILKEDGITPKQVAQVLAAWHTVHTGDKVGTIRRDPDTGAVAVRVESDGMPMWRVSTPSGEQYNDLQPTLLWPELAR
jgi:hypothetical protein